MKPGDTTRHAIIALGQGVRYLQLKAEQQYRPVVDEILRTGIRDAQHIERTLDGLLDFCGHDPVLAMYEELCRHYWAIDPAGAAAYVHAYRERWDNADEGDKG